MSATRDQINRSAIAMMAAGIPPPGAARQMQVAALAAGPGPEYVDPELRVLVDVAEHLTVGDVRALGSTTVAITSAAGSRSAYGLVIAAVEQEDESWISTILLHGLHARSGTIGPLYVDDAGILTSTYPGDPGDESAEAPWVWPIGWQITGSLAFIHPAGCFRPRTVTWCREDESGDITAIVQEMPE